MVGLLVGGLVLLVDFPWYWFIFAGMGVGVESGAFCQLALELLGPIGDGLLLYLPPSVLVVLMGLSLFYLGGEWVLLVPRSFYLVSLVGVQLVEYS